MESGEPSRQRRRSSILPNYLRRKSLRKDSTFASESTANPWPIDIDEKQPTLNTYQNGSSEDSSFKFGWINGVYIRTVLNIWGVMLFLRMGWITGYAGIVVSFLIVIGSTLVTIFTTLSMSAICTNGEVGTGGIYYMISRSLGPEAGSMIGIIFSFANAVLVSLNLVGAAETTVEILDLFDLKILDPINDARIYATILLIIVAIIPLIGMDWEAKAMFVLMCILMVALLNYIIGTFIPPTDDQIAHGNIGWGNSVLKSNLYPKFGVVSFSEVFGVFFPSVIGIFAGASMSGDLRDPNAAIPKGTFWAIFTTSGVYLILIIVLGWTVLPFASGNYEEMVSLVDPLNLSCIANHTCTHGLVNDYQTMTMSSAYGPIIYAGIYAATVSSALGSYVCSPRIFQALCEDKLFPYIEYFAKGYGKNNDPRRGYILTFIIAELFIAIGQLNAIAPIISNFFMASFCLVNITCFHASFVGSPSFRPTFRYYNKWASLITGLLCIVIMFYLDWISALITLLIMVFIYFYISKKRPEVDWGSSTRDHVYNNALFNALKLNHGLDHIKNFRPSILLMTGNPTARIPLVEFANHITKNRSLLMIGHIINYSLPTLARKRVMDSQYEWMHTRKIKAFYLLLESSSLYHGTKTMLQISGLGRKLSPNIVMLGYKCSWRHCLLEDLIDYYNIIIYAMEMSIGIGILRVQEGLDYADFFNLSTQQIDLNHTEHYQPSVAYNIASTPPPPSTPQSSQNTDNFDEFYEDASAEKKDFAEKIEKAVTFQEDRNRVFYQNYMNVNVENIKKLIPHDAITAINQFNDKQKPGYIDIWWLTEDGGLTILIPYLLSISYYWKDCPIRVFCFIKDPEMISSTQANIRTLLKRIRIPYTQVNVFAEPEIKESDKSKERFSTFINEFRTSNTSPQSKTKLSDSRLSKFEEKTNKYLKLRDLLDIHSKTSTLVVMTLPMPHQEIPPSLFMAWLETITEEMPPFLFVRGHENVIS